MQEWSARSSRLAGAAPLQVSGRGADVLRLLDERLGHQAGGVPRPSEADDEVHAVLDRIDQAVGEAERQVEVRIVEADGAQQRHDDAAAERGRQIDAEAASQGRSMTRQRFLRVAQDVERGGAAREVGLAADPCTRERDPARDTVAARRGWEAAPSLSAGRRATLGSAVSTRSPFELVAADRTRRATKSFES